MKIIVNDNFLETRDGSSVFKLLCQLSIDEQGTAIAINGTLVPHDNFKTHIINDGDRVDILRAVGGG